MAAVYDQLHRHRSLHHAHLLQRRRQRRVRQWLGRCLRYRDDTFYDFASSDFFYTSPRFPFPYLYDFGLNTVLYYYPDPNNAGHYNTDGVRYFYDFATGKIITK